MANSKEELEEEQPKHRSISVSEFFEKNRHLLGFDNPQRALLTSIKEAVDNSLDACEEHNILPEIIVELEQIEEETFKMRVTDNGPGVPEHALASAFAKLLYGSKFQSFGGIQQRGQQGIGISAVLLYSQLTTHQPGIIISKEKNKPAKKLTLKINIEKNEPQIIKQETLENTDKIFPSKSGIQVEFILQGKYLEGSKQSPLEYLRQTSVVNPHAKLTYISPKGDTITLEKVSNKLPEKPKKIKPHPHGIEAGILSRMLQQTQARTIKGFLIEEFDGVGQGTANEILAKANIDSDTQVKKLTSDQVVSLMKAMHNSKVRAPPLDCLSPIGEELLKSSIEHEYDLDFVQAVSRPPKTYRGFPFQVEVAIGLRKSFTQEDKKPKLMRFANKVPLLYQQGGCSLTKSVTSVNWKSYHVDFDNTPLVLAVSIVSVWVPFTSESKEAVAHYPEILDEVKLALQQAGRQLGHYINKTIKVREQKEKLSLFEKFIPEIADSLNYLTGENKQKLIDELMQILKKNLPLIMEQHNIDPKDIKRVEKEDRENNNNEGENHE